MTPHVTIYHIYLKHHWSCDSYGPNVGANCMAAWICRIFFSCSRHHSKLVAFGVSKWIGVNVQMRYMSPSKSKQAY